MSKSFAKEEFTAVLFNSMGIPKTECGVIYNLLFNQIETALADGKEVILPFGRITLVHVKTATKRNPKTGDEVFVPAHTKPVFKFFNSFKNSVGNLDAIK